jgi:hypothetical protein
MEKMKPPTVGWLVFAVCILFGGWMFLAGLSIATTAQNDGYLAGLKTCTEDRVALVQYNQWCITNQACIAWKAGNGE